MPIFSAMLKPEKAPVKTIDVDTLANKIKEIERRNQILMKYGGKMDEARVQELIELEDREAQGKINQVEDEKRRIADGQRIREECIKIGANLLKKGTVNIFIGDNLEKVTELEPRTLSIRCKCGAPFQIEPLNFYADIVRANQGDKSAMLAILMNPYYGGIRFDQHRCPCGEVTNIIGQYVL